MSKLKVRQVVPLITENTPIKDVPRQWLYFERKILRSVDPDTNCWFWTGAMTPQGYGIMLKKNEETGKSETFLVHREIAKIFWDFPERGVMVRITCGTRNCCNPNHYILDHDVRRLRPEDF